MSGKCLLYWQQKAEVSMDKVVVGRPAGGISINSELEFILDAEGSVRYFCGIEQAKDALLQDGAAEKDMPFFTFLHSCGVCRRCGAPLFPSLMEGYACQCFDCDEDFYSFEQDSFSTQEPDT